MRVSQRPVCDLSEAAGRPGRPQQTTTSMAAIRLRAASLAVLLFCVTIEVCLAERNGLPARFISVGRRKRSGPTVLAADEGDLSSPVMNADPEPITSHSEHNRKRRSLNDTAHLPQTTVFHLNDSHRQVMIDWAGEGSNVVVCVTRDSNQTKLSASHVFISDDYGVNFWNETSKFRTRGGRPAIINKFYKNDKFTSRFVFTDVINKYIHVTQNYGKNVISRKVIFTPSEVTHHPINAEVLLVYDREDTEHKLWISEDFGEEWRVIGMYVKSYYWLEISSPPTLYVEREEPSGSAAVVASQDLFSEDSMPTPVITGVEDFEVKGEFLFAVKKVHVGSSDKDPTLQMWISYRGGPFLKAEFPNTLDHQHYYVADISEGQVMVCVAHDQFMSNLYVSSVPRSAHHQVRFSLSLERILYYNPSTNWVSSWISEVADETFADLHPVEGVRGVFIASQLMANFTASSGNLGLEHLTSYITFDQGAQWKPLQPPRVDVDGNFIDCERANGCSLHVSQELSHLYPAAHTMPILSKKSAPGLILATGTIGNSLKGHTSLYLSADAGINWYQVLRGNYLYTFGDHGGIIVGVQLYHAQNETAEIQYSTDEGRTWKAYTFYSEGLRIYGLMTEPGENTTVFTLFGSKAGKHQWIIIQVDMKPVFQRSCTKDDYKTWSPSYGRGGRMCLLGRKQVYERRIPHTNCFSGVNYDRPISVENCPCDREDFECDFGFIDDMGSQKCLKDPGDTINPYDVPLTCKPGHFYNRTKGYRQIPGDTCEGGREYQYNPTITACPVSEEQEFVLVSARQEILRYDLVNPEAGLEPLPIPNLKMVIALDFDMANNCIYWSDVEEMKIRRLCFDGRHDVETLVDNNLRSVEGLAFDWISKNLYFVDGERKSLEVIRTDISYFGRMRRTLLNSSALDNPRGIALHPVRGYLFITDWSESSPKVARAYLDGSNLMTLFGVGVVGWPNGITVDFQTERIFFADAKLDYIASADLDGQHMRKIISNSDKVMQPFAVGIYKSTLFWDDWSVFQVMQADKEFGWGIAPIANYTRKGLVDLKVFGHWSQQGSNSCGNSSTHCSHLCIGRPNNQFVCLCPDGMKQVSETEECLCPDGSPIQEDGTCRSVNSTCPQNFFLCGNGKCIPHQWLCDTDNDCGDNSDEMEHRCGERSCDPPSWQCKNGHCITSSWRCDYDNDCGDHSDEEDCPYEQCPNNTFPCKNGRCIHLSWVCDMEDDCSDGSDEENCTITGKTSCRGTEFQCDSDRRCLPTSWRCDGDADCDDKSDEQDCQKYTCEAWHFPCRNKQCIFRSWLCDGEPDCEDRSDEVNCTSVNSTTQHPSIPLVPLFPPSNFNCTPLMFRCENSHCIPFWWRCDGLDDCGDSSDEDGCNHPDVRSSTTTESPSQESDLHTCLKDQFQCKSGSCIWETWVCDKDKDCEGGEDEENCPETMFCIDLDDFRCRRSGGCISSSRICDGQKDCADGSDEEGCVTGTSPVIDCPPGYFVCDGGACQALFKRCDGKHDCRDLTDEHNCTAGDKKEYFVTGVTVTKETNTSVTVKWVVNNGNEIPSTLEYMPSIKVKTAVSNPSSWQNMSRTSDTSYDFTKLVPYTTYVLKIFILENNGSKIFPSIKSTTFHTQQGIPSPPEEVKVEQVMDEVRVSWSPPVKPNGPIKEYHVYVSPPVPAQEVVIRSGSVTQYNIPLSLTDSKFTVWVTVANDAYMSEPSERVEFIRTSIDSPVQVNITNCTSHSVSLTWDPLLGVDGYLVSHSRPENEYQLGRITVNTTASHIEISDLAPGKEYVFEVQAYKNQLIGPVSRIEVKTKGHPLQPVQSLQAVLMEDVQTTVNLTWSEPPYKMEKIAWTYRIVWGKSHNELMHSANVATTNSTTLMVQGLDACETYLLAVMVEGPFGIGPVAVKRIQTGADPLAPPKNLQARLVNMTMLMTWETACPQVENDSLQYMLCIKDIVRNVTSYFTLLSQKNHTHSHSVRAHWGGRYSITAKTALKGARLSRPILCDGPIIPPPYELIYDPLNESFRWKNNETLPSEILNQNFTFVLYLSKNSDMSDAFMYECAHPPLVVNNVSSGIIYYAAVALKDADGYLSPNSQLIRFEKPIGVEIVLSQSSVVGVAVSVFLVVVALIVVVGVLAVRHRRLARSFLTFANSHYDRSQGTTLITTDHNLDEDDDSPMIRGFSDDEPLVIA
ncbi:sortilin-related receptor-like isoform X2 [Panulirus ornatus]|uniref:sortilin-related receptor-like isoform X2 n=1 Tax=Panulirus ornatus TaxID=150431 RepID=UPI003A8B7D0A